MTKTTETTTETMWYVEHQDEAGEWWTIDAYPGETAEEALACYRRESGDHDDDDDRFRMIRVDECETEALAEAEAGDDEDDE